MNRNKQIININKKKTIINRNKEIMIKIKKQ